MRLAGHVVLINLLLMLQSQSPMNLQLFAATFPEDLSRIGEDQMMRTTVRRKARELETAMGARKNEPSEEAPCHNKASRKESA